MPPNPYDPPATDSKGLEEQEPPVKGPLTVVEFFLPLTVWFFTFSNLTIILCLVSACLQIAGAVLRAKINRATVVFIFWLSLLGGITPVDVAVIRDGGRPALSLAKVLYVHDAFGHVRSAEAAGYIENRDFVVRRTMGLCLARWCVILNLP